MLGISPWALRPLGEQDGTVPILQVTKRRLREVWGLTGSHRSKESGTI